MQSLGFWVGFNVFVLSMLALDLGVFHRKAHKVSIKESAVWVAVWVTLAAIFGAAIPFFYHRGTDAAIEYFTGYILEQSLSMDNVFVIALIFAYFRVPQEYQHRVLFWGIIGVLLMRGAMIGVGAVLIREFRWILYLFGAFLIYTGFKMAFSNEDEEIEPEHNPVVKLLRRFMPIHHEFEGQKFFTTINGRRMATPLLVVLLIVETTDLVFAVDSIPAIFGVTEDPFIVYTSNVFAVLGLRSLYFLLAGAMGLFRYLKVGLSAVLVFVGIKMLEPFHHIGLSKEALAQLDHYEHGISLVVIVLILGISIIASLIAARNDPHALEEHHFPEGPESAIDSISDDAPTTGPGSDGSSTGTGPQA